MKNDLCIMKNIHKSNRSFEGDSNESFFAKLNALAFRIVSKTFDIVFCEQ